MWIVSKFGYYSVVQTKNCKDLYMVRARVEKDLINLIDSLPILKGKVVKSSEASDYHFRIFVDKSELDIIFIHLSNEIDYSNFKDKVKTVKNQIDKVPFYIEIWGVMFDYQYRDLIKNRLKKNVKVTRNNKGNKGNRKFVR